ncbi:IclR family transcriptional regulator [Candidimonas humi]|uniref:IclR family transcriptional regulator n=1 Tax=Candidimonas humi TaxID=683355 RepID=A0ABV8NZS0_9BURK|nr:IclR family transcriptional regulator [Candidimonas humi]
MVDVLNRSVERALTILKCYGAEDRGLTLAEISRRTGIHKATALRLLATLESHGMIARAPSGAFTLGAEVLRLGTLFADALEVAPIVRPILQRLVQATGESASLFVKEGNFRRCLVREETRSTIREHVRVGDLLPLPMGAFGRVIEAFGGAEPQEPVAIPIVTRAERVPDLASIATPVWQSGSHFCGAVGISIPLFRASDEAIGSAVRLVRDAGEELTRLLGGTHSRLAVPAADT